MYRTLLFIVAFTGFGLANAQMIVAPIKQKYWASSSELIFHSATLKIRIWM
jgi:hypothetical protein